MIVSDKRKRFGGIEVEWIPGVQYQPAKRTEGRADLKLSAKRKRIEGVHAESGKSGVKTTEMTKTIRCLHCKLCIKIDGPTEGTHEVSQRAACPYCETPNEVKWPMGAGYTVGRCDGDEIRK